MAGVGGLLYVKRNGAIYVPFYDTFGNVMGYWDSSGAVVAEYAYDAFGRMAAKSGHKNASCPRLRGDFGFATILRS